MRQALSVHARKGEAVMIDVAAGSILAERVICRDAFTEILNSFGEYFVVDYADIRSIRPAAVAQTSVVNARGEFSPAFGPVTPTRTVPVLPFTRRGSQ